MFRGGGRLELLFLLLTHLTLGFLIDIETSYFDRKYFQLIKVPTKNQLKLACVPMFVFLKYPTGMGMKFIPHLFGERSFFFEHQNKKVEKIESSIFIFINLIKCQKLNHEYIQVYQYSKVLLLLLIGDIIFLTNRKTQTYTHTHTHKR